MALDFLGLGIGNGGAVLDPSDAADDAGVRQQGFGERRLPDATVAYQGDVANLGRRERFQGRPSRFSSCTECEGRIEPPLVPLPRNAGSHLPTQGELQHHVRRTLADQR